MKLFLLTILFTINAFAAVNLRLEFSAPEIKQGSIIHAKLILDPESEQNFPMQSLKGKPFAKSLYFYQISPLLKTEGSPAYSADAKLIFITKPETNVVSEKINNVDVNIGWQNVNIIPTEAEKELLFGQFEVPARMKVWIWVLVGVICCLGLLFGYLVYRKKQIAKKSKAKKLLMKDRLLNCKSYEDVVEMWKTKLEILKAFPNLSEAFKTLEVTLFKYQFRPNQSPQDRDDVMRAYTQFTESIKGGLNGI